MDETTKSFGARISAVSAAMAYMMKGGFNSHFKYKFVSEAAVKEKLNPLLAQHGLFVARTEFIPVGTPTPGSCVVECQLTIADQGGAHEAVTYSGLGGGMDSGDKGPMKACAAALKYAIMQGFLSATGDDPEGDGDSSGPDELVKRIEACGTAEALQAVKLQVAALTGDDKKKCVEAYKAKAKEFS